jgi:hypothetical protein
MFTDKRIYCVYLFFMLETFLSVLIFDRQCRLSNILLLWLDWIRCWTLQLRLQIPPSWRDILPNQHSPTVWLRLVRALEFRALLKVSLGQGYLLTGNVLTFSRDREFPLYTFLLQW